MSDAVEQIKAKLGIVDVVSGYVELHPAGKNLKGRCPFHQEKTPSFNVSPERGTYHCFGCSQGGDIFTFVQTIDGVDFKGALKILAERAGVELVAEDPKKRTERERAYDVLEAATVFYTDYLATKKEATDYLEQRGVKPATLAKWRVGYAPGPDAHGWREAKVHLEGRGFTQKELAAAGLIKGIDTGKEPYDLFRDRIMFPICDASGRVVGFSGRILTKDSDAPKYVNSPETELFSKSEILFGYDKAKQSIRTMSFSLIVEGQFDVVMSHQAGYQNAVAVSGTALTIQHVSLLQRLSNRVVLALDNDKAGIAAVKRAADLMLARGMDVKVAKMEGGKDPADMIVHDVADFKHAIGQAVHVIEYLLDLLEAEHKDDRTFKLKVHNEILPFVLKIPNQIDQEHFKRLIAKRLTVSYEAIHAEVERLRDNEPSQPVHVPVDIVPLPPPKPLPVGTVERLDKQRGELLGYLIVMADIAGGTVALKIQQVLETVTGQGMLELREHVTPAVLSQLTFTLEEQVGGVPKVQLRADVAHAAAAFTVRTYKERLRILRNELAAVEERGGDTLAIIRELGEFQGKIGAVKYEAEDFA